MMVLALAASSVSFISLPIGVFLQYWLQTVDVITVPCKIKVEWIDTFESPMTC